MKWFHFKHSFSVKTVVLCEIFKTFLYSASDSEGKSERNSDRKSQESLLETDENVGKDLGVVHECSRSRSRNSSVRGCQDLEYRGHAQANEKEIKKIGTHCVHVASLAETARYILRL